MREFIVWDEEYEEFIDETECIFKDGTLYRNHDDYMHLVSDDLTMLWGIGKTDIEGKKVFSSSSIIEFIADTDDKYFVSWNKEKLNYSLYSLLDKTCLIDFFECENFKIVDTIQENKLCLL